MASARPASDPPVPPRPRALVVAYSCEPGLGSEPGTGWGVVHALMELAACTVLVGEEHIAGIRRWTREHPDVDARFVPVPEVRWARFTRWHRLPRFISYLAWIRLARRAARRLHREHAFDVAFHATMSVYWLPSPADGLGVPTVWGPVGGAVAAPRSLLRLLGWRGVLGQTLDLVGVRAMELLPATRRTWRRAAVHLLNNEETLRRLPPRLRSSAHILNHCLFADLAPPTRRGLQREGFLLFPSVLEPRKGPELAIRALPHAGESARLVFAHEGPEQVRLQHLARRLGVADRIEFRGRIPRTELFTLLTEAAAVVFAGLYEEGGMALTEAMLFGSPIVVLAHGGAETIARSALDPERVALIRPESVEETAQAMGRAMAGFLKDPPAATGPNLAVERATEALRGAVAEALDRARRP